MHLTFRNVNDAFANLVYKIDEGEIPTVKQDSRNGPVLRVPEPVLVTYTHPKERVLFNKARDANPFFHLFEALWMLAGRNDVRPLAYYNSKIGEIASDDGKTFNGAYGYRWRRAIQRILITGRNPHKVAVAMLHSFDQLVEIVNELSENPTSRRAVLQMWDMQDDLLRVATSKDVCCNTHAYFSLRKEKTELPDPASGLTTGEWTKDDLYLDMTVCNRSNDLIWGMLGANAVHFSMLQEYLAIQLDAEVGVYNQFTNNLHVYESNWKPEKWLDECEICNCGHAIEPSATSKGYPSSTLIRLMVDAACVNRFDAECSCFIDSIDRDYQEPFLRDVAQPMMAAFRRHKRRQYRGDSGALTLVDRIVMGDWRRAARTWIERRAEAWESKSATSLEE